jgi:site-specific DNA-cytosine methylase
MRRNQPEIPVFVGTNAWPVEAIKEDVGTIDFIYGNPPCAAWSPLGRVVQMGAARGEEQWSQDPRVDCTRVLFNALRFFEPTVWAWESVPQAYTRGRPLVHELTRAAWDLGYDVSYVLHNAQYISGLQHRKRFFMVAHRVAIPWETATFRDPIPAGVALARWEKRRPKHLDHVITTSPEWFLNEVQPGETLRGARARLPKKKRDRLPGIGFVYHKVHPERVAHAITGAILVHHAEPRWLTVQELAYLTGYPASYRFAAGNSGAKGGEIARGVCPPVGAWLAQLVASGIRGGTATTAEPHAWEVNLFKPPGAIEEVTDEVR